MSPEAEAPALSPAPATPAEPDTKALIDAGLHFGHQTKRWNPKMRQYVFAKRNGIYIIDMAKTLALLKHAQQFLYETAAAGKSVLFVATKRQCQESVRDAAVKSGQPYVTNRWLGGTLTNMKHIMVSINRLTELDAMQQKGAFANMPPKEVSRLRHELARLSRNLIGLTNLREAPGAVVVFDITCDAIAVKEANRMGIPVVGLVDTNCDPTPIDYPIPGNDDGIRAVKLVADVLADAVLKGAAEYAKAAAELARKREAEAAEKPAAEEPAAGGQEAGPRRDRRERPPRGGRRDQHRGPAPGRGAGAGRGRKETSQPGRPAASNAKKSAEGETQAAASSETNDRAAGDSGGAPK